MDAVERQVIAEEARRSLHFFTRRMFMARRGFKWVDNWHHREICRALMRVFKGETTRLIINIPPRYSKTEIAVVNFIAWALGHWPDAEFIHASYSATLAANNAGAARALVQTDEYRDIFPDLQLAPDSQAKADWRTTQGGVVYAAGAGGTITGFGAGKMRAGFGGAVIIDDPHKADEATSETMRQNVIDWFQNTIESRRNSPETPIILIMQRLHESDLAGFLLSGGNGEQWEHLCLSAVQNEGTEQEAALWPLKHSLDKLREMERASPYVFAGQYRQRPAPREGGIFKPDAIQVIDALPAGYIRWVRGWDLASTMAGDWTAGAKLGVLPDGRFIIGDMVRLREGPDNRDAAIRNTASMDGSTVRISLPQDPGQAGKTQALAMTRMLAGYPVHTSPESGDKVTRAEIIASQVNVGNVLMLRGPWNRELINEMRMFPNGAHDDQIDALSRANEALIGAGDAGMIGTRVAGL